jgi:hypothetical protein|tara:strand:- start:376 stop:546 length:171 start_codon:yes stop_codon:yes gene_type:complete
MINELMLEIDELESAVDQLKKIDKPEAFVAIRTIDVMVERKRAMVQAFEMEYANEN